MQYLLDDKSYKFFYFINFLQRMSRLKQMRNNSQIKNQYQSQSYLKNNTNDYLKNNSNEYLKNNSNDYLGLQSYKQNMRSEESNRLQNNQKPISQATQILKKSLRLNVINKQYQSQRISLIVDSNCSISQVKRKIQIQFHELHSKSLLVKVIQDSNGFTFSNNSLIGDHVNNNDTIYIVVHHQKQGDNMNLSSEITDIFMTMRYVTKSVITKLKTIKNQFNIRQILSELITLGFWYSNTQIVTDLMKLINSVLQKQQLIILEKGSGEILDGLLIKFISFWLFQMPNALENYAQLFEQLLLLIQKLSTSAYYVGLLKSTKIVKKIVQISKLCPPSLSKICLTISRNSNSKREVSAPSLKMQYTPTIFNQQNTQQFNVQQVLQMLSDKDQQTSRKGLQIMADKSNGLCVEATVRFDYYYLLISKMLQFNHLNQKRNAKMFTIVVQEIATNTTETRAIELLDKNLLKNIHQFLQQSPLHIHSAVIRYTSIILGHAAKNGQLNVKKTCEYLNSPYQQFQIIICQSLQKCNDFHVLKGKGFALMYINNIKDFIRYSLKTQNQIILRPLLKILSNLCLDQQCRYQILNLKGIQIFVKLLQTNRSSNQIQRICTKGLLNLAISSRDTKVRVLAQITNIIELYYKRQLDSIASGYVQAILKTSKI